ncbi:ribonuclease HIII [Lactococcus hodotermopsidis]|uniref:Ribonuclease HIII n=1 Tax=Pseudolactococcus hodotermopsidis TaxID=2709157 RepID=A0A6A0BDQ7_9LACT|nr:ribonuclease HIII [Lactococcus hodotermopsidis]GFH42815.1 ribonuclease HIII [Lactococcus hodotermopsidis]
MNIVLKMSAEKIAQLIDQFQDWAQPSANEYSQFLAKPVGATITVYTSGKVVFQGDQAENYAKQFGYQPEKTPPLKKQTNLIGTDEVGNGSYFGGLAVVATYLAESDLPLIKKLGVDDSKKLTDVKIRQIAPILIEKIQHKALLLSPAKYNEVIENGYNAVSVKVALHNQAIFLLENALNIVPDQIIIDAFTTEKNYTRYLQSEKNQTSGQVTLVQKAESQYYAVAASSVIARKLFLDQLAKLSEEVSMALPSGAGHQSDVTASKLIQKYGESSLNNVAKRHFANTEKARKLSK